MKARWKSCDEMPCSEFNLHRFSAPPPQRTSPQFCSGLCQCQWTNQPSPHHEPQHRWQPESFISSCQHWIRFAGIEPGWNDSLQQASCCRALPGSPDDSKGFPPVYKFQIKDYPTPTLPSSGGWWWSRSCLQWSCDIWLAVSSFSCSVSTSWPRPPKQSPK